MQAKYATHLACCVATMVFAIAFVLPAFCRIPVLWYLPAERYWSFEIQTPGIAMDYYGRCLMATVAACIVASATYLVARRFVRRDPGRQFIAVFTVWAVTFTMLVITFYTWRLVHRVLVPPTTEVLPDLTAAASELDVPTPLERNRLADVACPRIAKPFYYRVERAGKVSYLLGTRHTGVPLAKFSSAVTDQLHAARLGVVEVAPDDRPHLAYRALDLSKELGSSTWNHYIELVGPALATDVSRGRPSSALQAMSLVYEDIDAQLDNEITLALSAAKIPVRALETAKFQQDLIDQLIDIRLLHAFIDQTMDRRDLETDTFRDVRGYCNGTRVNPRISEADRSRLLDAGYQPADVDAMDETLVFARTERWTTELEPLLADGGVFIAVGVDHVIGDRGLVALLAARGYEVTRIILP